MVQTALLLEQTLPVGCEKPPTALGKELKHSINIFFFKINCLRHVLFTFFVPCSILYFNSVSLLYLFNKEDVGTLTQSTLKIKTNVPYLTLTFFEFMMQR